MKKTILILFISVLGLTSCHSDLDQLPNSEITSGSFFNNPTEAEIAMNGAYRGLYGANGPFGQFYVQMSTHGSHVVASHANFTGINPVNLISRFVFDPVSKPFKPYWQSCYKTIFRCNQVIDRTNGDDALSKRIVAEAKFIRALMYFDLVQFFGEIPIFRNEITDASEAFKSRSPLTDVYNFIEEDLIFAEENLLAPYWIVKDDVNSFTAGDLGRPTNTAAKGLLAKVYLTRASYPLKEESYYTDAFNKAKEVIDLNYHVLDADYGSLFTVAGEKSHEWLYQVQFDNGLGAGLGCIWGGVGNVSAQNGGKVKNSAEALDWGFGRNAPTLNLVQSYEIGDPRLEHNVAKGKLNPDNSIKYNPNQKNWYEHKFRFAIKAESRFNTDMNAPILRYADVLLVYAEAAANMGGKDSEAMQALELIRSRARGTGAFPSVLSGLTGDQLKREILWERARELCFEGHSRKDIVRMGEAVFNQEAKGMHYYINETQNKTELVPWDGNIDFSKHKLFPIPAAEISSNPMINENNPGYN